MKNERGSLIHHSSFIVHRFDEAQPIHEILFLLPPQNADANKFCQQCGRPLDAVSAGPSDATVRWTGGRRRPGSAPSPPCQSKALFASKSRIVIGRGADCDVCPAASAGLPLPRPARAPAGRPAPAATCPASTASASAAAASRDPIFCKESEQVGIGPFLFSLRQGVIHSLDNSRSLRLEARGLEKVIPLRPTARRASCSTTSTSSIEPGEFVSLLGPSGSGKSTLMDCLNGRRRATGGKVLANGEDFYRHFDNFRQSLGYVPQKDIVHTQLTVYRALYYTARLRLPTDTGPDGVARAASKQVMREMELEPHRDTLVGQPQRRPDQARQPRRRTAGQALPALHRRGHQRPRRRHRGRA